MPEPISALASFGAFKRLTFETIYANVGSFLGITGVIGGFAKHTTISTCTTILRYLDISTKWTRWAQMWANDHKYFVVIIGIALMTVSFSLLGSNRNFFRSGSTVIWGVAILLSPQTINPKIMSTIVVFALMVFLLLLIRKYMDGELAGIFLTSLFYCLPSLWLSLSGSQSLRCDDTSDLSQ